MKVKNCVYRTLRPTKKDSNLLLNHILFNKKPDWLMRLVNNTRFVPIGDVAYFQKVLRVSTLSDQRPDLGVEDRNFLTVEIPGVKVHDASGN